MTQREKAAEINGRALELQNQGCLDQAVELYEEACAVDPSWSTPLYNLGLVFKRQCKWQESLACNQRAAEIDPGNKAAWWNLGIAATALGRWEAARSAWRGFGIKIPDGDGPIHLFCGYGPIRLNPDGNAEVVWANRIDPARAVLTSIPFPESRYRWRDVVLNDGAPTGYRKCNGKDVPVFNALELLEPSAYCTYVARVTMPGKRVYAAKLAHIAAELQGSAEDWSTSTRVLCKACSEGRPHEAHDSDVVPKVGAHLIGVAARDRQHATKILRTWESGAQDIHIESLVDALEAGWPK